MIYRLNQFVLFLSISTIIIKRVSSQTSSRSDCTVLDGIHVHTYNFDKLSDSDISISDDKANETIRLRLCSPLLKKCGGRDGYSICLRKDEQEIGIGKWPLKLVNMNHTLLFNSTGDFCQSNKNYTILIIMKCDYSVTGESGPQLFPDRADPCKLHMIWYTKLACTEAVPTDCSITDKANNTFDLTPLKKTSENYIVFLDKKHTAKMIINVCHSIIHEHGASCARAVGACLANSSNVDNEYANYGEPQPNSLVIENDILKLKYTRGDMCPDPGRLDDDHKTTISFICDHAAIDTTPKFSNESKPCDYKFTWKTAFACSKTSLDQHRRNADTICTVVDPETKVQFNFRTLMNRDITVNTTDNVRYKFRICGPIIGSGCPEGSGICDTRNNVSAGTATSNLMWRHGGPYLNYTNGISCGNGQKRFTLIAFVCGVKGSNSLPIVIKDEPCYLIIQWYTELACDNKITCARNETNLVPLIRSAKNFVVKALGTEFHINICRPLVPTPGLACAQGSAVCQAVPNTKGQYTKEISLGFPDEDPVSGLNPNDLILNYRRGSPCPENLEKNISSSFKFFCDYEGDAGLPEYKSYSNCTYNFEWRTNVICPAVAGTWSSPCTIKDSSHPNELDLSSLYTQPIPRFVTTKGKNYSINICGGKEHCKGSAVCQETNGYGTSLHVTFDHRSKLIKLQYSNGTKCSNESYASELSLICNNTAGIGDPVLKLDANCSALFEWQTSVACPKGSHKNMSTDPSIVTEKTSSDTTETYSTSIQTWIVSITLILVILVIGIWLYLRNPSRCAHLRSRIGAITATKNHSRVQYSRVNTTEEAHLLLDNSDPCIDGQIDSDDELLGV